MSFIELKKNKPSRVSACKTESVSVLMIKAAVWTRLLLLVLMQGTPPASSGQGSLPPERPPEVPQLCTDAPGPQPFHAFQFVRQNLRRKAALQGAVTNRHRARPEAGDAHRGQRAGGSSQRQDEVQPYDTSLMTHLAIKEKQSQPCFTTRLAQLTPCSGVSCSFASRRCQVFVRQQCVPACSTELGRALKIASRSIIDCLEMVLHVGSERIDISVRQE